MKVRNELIKHCHAMTAATSNTIVLHTETQNAIVVPIRLLKRKQLMQNGKVLIAH